MSESTYLRQLAEAIDYYERLKGFDFKVAHNSDVRVEWMLGKSCVGYREMSEAISAIAAERYDEMRTEAMSRAADRIQQARNSLDGWRHSQLPTGGSGG